MDVFNFIVFFRLLQMRDLTVAFKSKSSLNKKGLL